jgi:hypothetical protein
MPNDGYFDIKRDNKLIAAGTHFWCEACLVARPIDNQSLDPRYCQGCYEVLVMEAEMLKETGTWRRPEWLPTASPDTKRGAKKDGDTPTPIPQNMSTLKDEKITVDIIRPRIGKRGPRKMELPDDKIKQLHEDGMEAKAIATQLKREHGIEVSYKTIQRLLSGERRCESS